MEKLPKDSIKTILGIDMDLRNDYDSSNRNSVDVAVRLFMSCSIDYSYDLGDSLKISEVKNAFDIFCINRQIPTVDDMYRFLESFIHYLNPGVQDYIGWKGIGKDICNIIEFRGIRLREHMVPIINAAPNDNSDINLTLQEQINNITAELKELREFANKSGTPVITAIQKSNKTESKRNDWSDENHIREFITFCDTNGRDSAAKEYGISVQTVSKYYRKYSGKISTPNPLYQFPQGRWTSYRRTLMILMMVANKKLQVHPPFGGISSG